jgi:hypothetical protein
MMIKWLGHASCGRKEKFMQALVGKPAGKRSLSRLGCNWENNIKTDLEKRAWFGLI